MADFETFTRDKIARLRAEADALEKSLKEYLGSQARVASASRRSGGDQPRGGAFGVVLEAISSAGPNGLTLDEMEAAAMAEGYEVNRPTLRAQVWKAKKDGLLIQITPGQYRSAALNENLSDTIALAAVDNSNEGGGFRKTVSVRPRETFLDTDEEIPF